MLNTVLAKVQQKAFPLAEFLDSAIFLGELFKKKLTLRSV